MNLKKTNDKMTAFFRNRLETMGIGDGGLNNYYAERIQKGSILGEHDFYLIDEIQKRYAPGTFIHEVACGAAQLGHVLALSGYKVVASECDAPRFKLASELGECVGSKCIVVKGNSFELETEARVYVTANAVSSHVNMVKNIGFIRSKLSEGCELILNLDLYGSASIDNRKILSDNGIKFAELEKGFVHIGGKNDV
jgi:hypothetical protein